MHKHLRERLEDALHDCALHTPEGFEEEDGQRIDPCADENEYASRVVEVGLRLHLRSRLDKRRVEIEDALKRLDLGGYGECAECGEDIGLARLVANPVATLCVVCQADREEQAARLCA